jgi:hypothetical protein
MARHVFGILLLLKAIHAPSKRILKRQMNTRKLASNAKEKEEKPVSLSKIAPMRVRIIKDTVKHRNPLRGRHR